MRCTEQEIKMMEEYETLKANHMDIEEALQSGRLRLEERNALEHLLDLSAGEMEDSRSDYFSVLTGRP